MFTEASQQLSRRSPLELSSQTEGQGGLCLSGDFALSSTLYSEIVTDLQEVAQILHRVLCTLHPAPRSCAHSGDSWVTVVPHQSREIH